jgi:hypothetical protein
MDVSSDDETGCCDFSAAGQERLAVISSLADLSLTADMGQNTTMLFGSGGEASQQQHLVWEEASQSLRRQAGGEGLPSRVIIIYIVPSSQTSLQCMRETTNFFSIQKQLASAGAFGTENVIDKNRTLFMHDDDTCSNKCHARLQHTAADTKQRRQRQQLQQQQQRMMIRRQCEHASINYKRSPALHARKRARANERTHIEMLSLNAWTIDVSKQTGYKRPSSISHKKDDSSF